MSVRHQPARTFVTGGAGFIGGELVASLLALGGEVTVFDDLSNALADWSDPFSAEPRFRFVRGDANDIDAIVAAMPGHDRVVHLAAGTDIAGGFAHPERDFVTGIATTEAVCDAMRQLEIKELWYASSGVVYGHPDPPIPSVEHGGPLLPESHYAAAKLAGEAIISGFAHLYGWRAFIYRFGNTVGMRSNHGVVHDFVVKLLRDPSRLEVLGDGSQAKPYIAVGDLVNGMRHAATTASPRPVTILNVGPQGTLSVREVADIVISALGLRRGSVELEFQGTGGGGGWPGDTARVEFDTTAIRSLGWRPSMTAEQAVHAAARGISEQYRATGRSLLTAAERRSAERSTVWHA